MTAFSDITGVVLAGGEAQRMGGGEKALLDLCGRPLIAYVLQALEPLFPEIVIVTPRPDAFDRFSGGHRVVSDRHAGAGPLGGIHAGLEACGTTHAFVAACDMPFLDALVVERLVRRRGEADMILPRVEGRDQTLHAVYASALMTAADRILDEGGGSPRDLAAQCTVLRLGVEEFDGIPGWERSFRGVNTPEALELARSQLAEAPESGRSRIE